MATKGKSKTKSASKFGKTRSKKASPSTKSSPGKTTKVRSPKKKVQKPIGKNLLSKRFSRLRKRISKKAPAASGRSKTKLPKTRAKKSVRGTKSIASSPKTTAPRNMPRVARRQFWTAQWGLVRSATQDFIKSGKSVQKRIGSRMSSGFSSPQVYLRPKRSVRRSTKRYRKSRYIKLVGRVQHSCPYCLEEIIKNDPRGVRVCPDCKTKHHADCWAMTGMCQVPHEM